MRICIYSFIWLLIAVAACQPASRESQIRDTAERVIKAIRDNELASLQALMDTGRLNGERRQEITLYEFKKSSTLYARFLEGKRPPIEITNQLDPSGRLKVIIPFYRNPQAMNDTVEVRLELFFGPETFVPLSRFSDFEMVVEAHHGSLIFRAPIKKQLRHHA